MIFVHKIFKEAIRERQFQIAKSQCQFWNEIYFKQRKIKEI